MGKGSLFRRKFKKPNGEIYEGEIYWVKYYRHGKAITESTHTNLITKAQRMLNKRLGEVAMGLPSSRSYDKVTFDELAKDLALHYEVEGNRSTDRLRFSAAHLTKSFGGRRAVSVGTSQINEYIKDRQEQGAANATINRELAALTAMFNYGRTQTPRKVAETPYIPMLEENNVRQGFFEKAEFLALRAALPEPINSIATLAYHSGFRKGEILGPTWDKVDLREGTITLPAESTKNKRSRVLHTNSELMAEMKALHSKRHLGCPQVFPRNGQPVKDFREAWADACAEVGLQGKIFHDFRRTAVRNMVRAGIPEKVAMEISGHQTRTVFERYNISSQDDLKEAARKQDVYWESEKVSNGGNLVATGTSKKFDRKRKTAQVLDFKGGAREGI